MQLLTVEKLDFKKALDLSQTYEEGDKSAQQLKEATVNVSVQKVTSSTGSTKAGSTTRCDGHANHRCGLTNYNTNNCRFKEATCHRCGKKSQSMSQEKRMQEVNKPGG